MWIPRQVDEPDERTIPRWRGPVHTFGRLAKEWPTVDEILDWQAEGDAHAIACTVHEGGRYEGLGIYLDPRRYHGPPDNLPAAPRQSFTRPRRRAQVDEVLA